MGTAVDSSPNTSAGFVAPDWVIVTRAGRQVFNGWNASLSNNSPTNTGYAVGRYAYAIYDQGGLLDMNVAGYPTALTAEQAGGKGALALADLTQIGLLPGQIDNIVGWRNYATAQPGGYFNGSDSSFTFNGATATNWLKNFVADNKSGFTQVSGTMAPGGETDQAFLSRQQLLNLRTSFGFSQDALQYMGTFTRSLNAPSYTPSPTRPKVQAQSPSLSTQGNDDQFNPSLINTRVSTSFPRADGTTAQVGEPLIKHRFPLSRLAWLTHEGPSATASAAMKTAQLNAGVSQATIDLGTAANILVSFGLVWNGSTKSWFYNHGAPAGTIAFLSQLATMTPKREPDFFELLQAGILVGSTGKNLPVSVSPFTTSVMDAYWRNNYFQTIQIGANVIDQYTPGSYPTTVVFNGTPFTGIKNLPYLNRVVEAYYRFQGSDSVPPYPTSIIQPYVGGWYQPEIWNPHQNATTPASFGPTQFRFRASGGAYVEVWQDWPHPSNGHSYSVGANLSAATPVQFSTTTSGANSYADPLLLTPALVTNNPGTAGTAAAPNNLVTENGQNFAGLFVAKLTNPELGLNPTYMDANYPPTDPSNVGKLQPAIYHQNWSILAPNPTADFFLDYLDSDGNWVPYTQWVNNAGAVSYGGGNPLTYVSGWDSIFRFVADPRTARFGPTATYMNEPSGVGAQAFLNAAAYPGSPTLHTVRPSESSNGFGNYLPGASSSVPGWKISMPGVAGWPGSIFFGLMAQNKSANTTNYHDIDGTVRAGDAAYASGSNGQPLTTQNYPSRPVVLSRPFRSVAEMGYAFRDLPWKTLDFFTADSADSALLDLFCLQESPVDSVVAGTVNLNTRQAPVLQAVLAGAIKNHSDSTSGISPTELPTLLASVTTVTTAAPLLNRSELATRVAPAVTYAAVSDNAIKTRREAAVRALSDVGDTRTWNLLIDVVAQSGRYPSSASNLSQFVVEGEKRYWLHVAIDRFTGKVISQSMEPVYE